MPLAHHQYRAARGSPNGASTLAALFKSVTMKPITSPIRTATISSYSLLPQRNGRVKPRCAACGQSRCNSGNDQKERRHACESNRIGRFDADKHAGHCACETDSRNHADCDAYRAEAQSVSDYKLEDASGRRAEGHPDADLRRPLSHDV